MQEMTIWYRDDGIICSNIALYSEFIIRLRWHRPRIHRPNSWPWKILPRRQWGSPKRRRRLGEEKRRNINSGHFQNWTIIFIFCRTCLTHSLLYYIVHKKIEIETLLYIEFEMSTEIIDGLSLILHLFLLFAEAKQTVLSEHSREWYI